jgi:hypothetical protein
MENFRGVAVARVEKPQEKVLDFNIVVGARETEAGGGFEGSACRVVEFSNQAF